MNARLTTIVLLLATACVDQGDVCCDCLIENSCWDTALCEEDPLGSCKYTIGSGDLPAYVDGDETQVCFSVLLACSDDNCASECADEF